MHTTASNLDNTKRASKKQQEMYDFVADFINNHGYGPSYREIMSALGYKSVSTVAVHVDGLVQKGYLKKLEGSARSLALADIDEDLEEQKAHEDWLVALVKAKRALINDRSTKSELAEIETLEESLKILGLNKEKLQ